MSGLEKINTIDKGRARVLIAPLDWGLGHTTRCLPIIKAFQAAGAEVAVACNNVQSAVLAHEVEGVEFYELPGYGFRYATSRWLTRIAVIAQIPKILISINRERRSLRALLKSQRFNVVVSDNRYGFHHPSVYAIFVTHQLRIRVPFSKILENLLQVWNYRFIQRFNECWIPDFEGQRSLAGELSHPRKMPAIKWKYVGALSRFKCSLHSTIAPLDIAVVLSGPEPQRTILEHKIVAALADWNATAIVVRGTPTETTTLASFKNVSFHNHLPTAELNELLNRASFIVARCGYTTVMDIVSLRKRSILIPTPGQTEQEYLAAWLMKNKLCYCVDQENFNLAEALNEAKLYDYADANHFATNQIEFHVSNFMQEYFKESIQPDA